MIGVALLFGKIIFRSNNEPEIADAGCIEPRRVDFIEDAMANREPYPALRARSRSDRAFGAGSPARRDTRCAWWNRLVCHSLLIKVDQAARRLPGSVRGLVAAKINICSQYASSKLR